MSMNQTPSGERIHIGIFGRRNAGKSSIINALTGQELAIVSEVRGTTTDPVSKSMELLPLGPVVMIDTPGLDDEGGLGALRIQKAYQMLNKSDIALLVIDGRTGITAEDRQILERIRKKNIPYAVIFNKADIVRPDKDKVSKTLADSKINEERSIWVSAETKENIHQLKELIASLIPAESPGHRIVGAYF